MFVCRVSDILARMTKSMCLITSCYRGTEAFSRCLSNCCTNLRVSIWTVLLDSIGFTKDHKMRGPSNHWFSHEEWSILNKPRIRNFPRISNKESETKSRESETKIRESETKIPRIRNQKSRESETKIQSATPSDHYVEWDITFNLSS